MNDNEFIISAQENGIEKKNYAFEGEVVTKNIVLDDAIAKNRQEINDLKENSATKAELNQLDQEIKNVKSYSRSAFKFCLGFIIFFIFGMLAVLLFAPDLNSTKDTITSSTNSEAESGADTIIKELGLPKSKDYAEYTHDGYQHHISTTWTLADGTLINSEYSSDGDADFGPSNTLGIDRDLNSYIYIYDEDTDKLIYESGNNFLRHDFNCKEYYADRGLNGGIVYIDVYQTKGDKVFRKDTFINIKID